MQFEQTLARDEHLKCGEHAIVALSENEGSGAHVVESVVPATRRAVTAVQAVQIHNKL
jgi:hypothetical protein